VALNLQTQFTFDFGPRPRLPLARLLEASAQSFRLIRREHIAWVYNLPGLHEHAVAVFGERHEIPLAQVEVVEDFAGNHHLAPLES
jgi:hypothetical protein